MYTTYTHFCITNKDLLNVIKRNPNLKKIHLSGFKMSHKVLKQILLCEKLTYLRFEEVGLWSTTAQKVKKDIRKLKKKGPPAIALSQANNPALPVPQPYNTILRSRIYYSMSW